ncbi:MAG: hypothetical protein ACK5ZW_16895 [Betaproteobacteria bacterium]|jgi:hypothetical protein
MRRSDFDITNRIRTTDAIEVSDHVAGLFRALFPKGNPRPMERAFAELSRMYYGKHPDYHPCDTEYHDIQHVLDVTLAMARLLDGYQRDPREHAPLSPEHFTVGIVTALFHDVGYLRRRSDRKHRYGAEYTLTHVSRGSRFLRSYLPGLGLLQYAQASSVLIHFTGYERDPTSIRMADPVMRRVGEMLGSADIMAQMSDRCYLEKCYDRLYPEFVLGGIARRRQPDGRELVLYKSRGDLISKTPAFFINALKRLDEKLGWAYRHAETHFGGKNLYIQEMHKNARYAKAVNRRGYPTALRRLAPKTLLKGVKAFPDSLAMR